MALIAVILKLYYSQSAFIFDTRGFWPEERVEGGFWKEGSFLFLTSKFLERLFYKRSNRVIVLTNKAKEILCRKYEFLRQDKIKVIPTCVDVNHFRSKFRTKDGLNLCYSGSLGPWHQIDEIVTFFNFLSRYVIDLKLHFLVNWTSQQFLENEKKYLISLNNIYIKTVSYSELPYFLDQMDFAIYFYNRPLSAAGCCPTKLGEFLSMGLPVITNRGVGDCDAWIEENNVGIILDSYSNKNYENGIGKILNMTRDSLIHERCRKLALKYLSLEIGLERYKEVIFSDKISANQ